MSGATLRVYNPATLTADELRAQFVARMPILERLLDELRGAERPQHQLLVGPRGMGKTTLLRRLAVGVLDDAALAARWLPIPFEEEQYNVAHLSDFWANCLDALGDALEEVGDHAAAAAIDALVDALPGPEAPRAEAAWAALIGWARAHRRLVLLIDNLDLILGRLDKDEEWTLRECLGDQEALVVIAASPHPLDADVDYSRAFFDYFAVTELRPLERADAEALLLTLGERFGAPKVARTIRESPGIFRALHALSGGNPRALVLLYNVLAHEDLDSAHGYLEGMLDLATPLFKARIEELAPQAQQVLVGLALAEDPLTPTELASRIRLDPTVTAVQLGRLAKEGLVTRIDRPGSRAAAHLVSERVMALWYRMRASRRERRKLEAEVDFLEMLYGEERLRDHARRWALREPCSDGDERSAMLSMVVGARVGDEGLLASVAESFAGSVEKLRGIIGKLKEKEEEFAGVVTMAERMAMLREAERRIREAGVGGNGFVELLMGSISLSPAQKSGIGARVRKQRPAQIAEVERILREEDDRFRGWFGAEAWSGLQRATAAGYLADYYDQAGAEAAATRLGLPGLPVLVAAIRVANREATTEVVRDRLLTAPAAAGPYVRYAQALLLRTSEPARAEVLLRQLVAEAPGMADATRTLALWLHERGESAEALELLRTNPDQSPALQIGVDHTIAVIASQSGRLDEADAAYQRCIPGAGERRDALLEYASFLADKRGDLHAATATAQQAVKAGPPDVRSLRALARLLERAGAWAEAATRRAEILALQPGPNAAVWAVFDLRRAGRIEAATSLATEWLERASDHAGLWDEWHRLAAARGDHAEAARAAERAAKLSPDNAGYANSAAWELFLLRKRQLGAVKLARRAVTAPNPSRTHTAATVLTWAGHWDEAVPHARHFLSEGDDAFVTACWDDIVLFFKEAVATGHAEDARRLLIETNRAEPWRPLAEALAACAAGTDAHLRALLPEQREPALLLYERLNAGEADRKRQTRR